MFTIVKTTPSSITIADGERTMKILGESFARGFGSPDFIIDLGSIRSWSSPSGTIPLGSDEKEQLVRELIDELTRRNWVVIAE